MRKIAILLLLCLIIPTRANAITHQKSISGIESPRMGTPVFIEPGGAFNVTVELEASSWEVYLRNRTWRGAATIIRSSKTGGEALLVVRPPDNAIGLFDLEVVADGQTLVEPHSVVVRRFTDELTIMVIGDVHYSLLPHMWKMVKGLRKVVDDINSFRPDLAIFVGDQVDYTRNETQFQAFMDELLQLEVPAILVCGNNDFVNNKPDLFIKYEGEAIAYREVGPISIVILNSGNGIIREDQRSWLAEVLPKLKGKHVFVLFHHPIDSLKENDPSGTDDLLKILNSRENVYILAGHIHRNKVTKYDNVVEIVTVSPTNPSDGKAENRVIRVKGETLSYQETYEVGSFAAMEMPNDGSMVAMTATFGNPTNEEIELRPVIRLKDMGLEAKVEGVEKSSEYVYEGVRYVELKLTISPGGSSSVKCYYSEDQDRPKVSIEEATWSKQDDSIIFEVGVYAEDKGWGVKEVRLNYKINGEWKSDVKTGGGRLNFKVKLGKDVKTIEYKVSAIDWAGNTYETAVETIQVKTGIQVNKMVLVAGVLVAVIAIAVWIKKGGKRD